MYQAEGKTRAQEWVGNMGNKSHEALDKYKVLTGYHFDSCGSHFSLRDSPLRSFSPVLYLHKDVREEESEKDTT